ncbi:hypothetical protein [Angustibacter speluncae]
MATNDVVRGASGKPVSSAWLAEYFESTSVLQGGQLFTGYPIATAADRRGPIDAVYVSPAVGVIIFDLVEGNDLGDVAGRQDDAYNRIEVRLKQHSALVARRRLKIPLHTMTVAPGASDLQIQAAGSAEYPIANSSNLDELLGNLNWAEADEDVSRQALSALQSISQIRTSAITRSVLQPDSRGAKLRRLEESIATLDLQQSKAVTRRPMKFSASGASRALEKQSCWH